MAGLVGVWVNLNSTVARLKSRVIQLETRQQRDKERHEGTIGFRPQNRINDCKAAKMIWIILATVLVNATYKAREYGRADVADIIIFVAACSIIWN